MKMSLKKFIKDPYKNIQKAPVVIVVNKKPQYAIIPYIRYIAHSNAPQVVKDSLRARVSRRLHALLFE